QPSVARYRRVRDVRAHLRLRPRDAALSRRARDRAGRGVRGHRQAAVRRAAVRPLRRRGPRAGRGVDPRDARGGGGVNPPPPPAVPTASDPLPVPSRSELARLRARPGLRGVLPLLGPAFVAAVAYVDPGNFATNIAGGAKYGYLLLWVVVAANLMAMLIQ